MTQVISRYGSLRTELAVTVDSKSDGPVIVNEDDVKAAAKAVETYLKKSTGKIRAQIAEIGSAREKDLSLSH